MPELLLVVLIFHGAMFGHYYLLNSIFPGITFGLLFAIFMSAYLAYSTKSFSQPLIIIFNGLIYWFFFLWANLATLSGNYDLNWRTALTIIITYMLFICYLFWVLNAKSAFLCSAISIIILSSFGVYFGVMPIYFCWAYLVSSYVSTLYVILVKSKNLKQIAEKRWIYVAIGACVWAIFIIHYCFPNIGFLSGLVSYNLELPFDALTLILLAITPNAANSVFENGNPFYEPNLEFRLNLESEFNKKQKIEVYEIKKML